MTLTPMGYRTVLQDGPAAGHTIVSSVPLPDQIVMARFPVHGWVRVLPSPEPWPEECRYALDGFHFDIVHNERIDSYFQDRGVRGPAVTEEIVDDPAIRRESDSPS